MLGVVCCQVGCKLQQRGQVGWAWGDDGGARLHAPQVEQVVDELRHAQTLVAHRLEVLALLLARPVLAQQQFGETDEGGDQVAHLVTDNRDGIGLHC